MVLRYAHLVTATITSRKAPHASATNRRHSWLEARKSGTADAFSMRCPDPDRERQDVATFMSGLPSGPMGKRSDDLARNQRVFVERIYGAKPVVAVGHDQSAAGRVAE